METFFVIPEDQHNAVVEAAFKKRGFSAMEARAASKMAAAATCHGNRTHNAIKALHLDHLFGSGNGGCVPGARIERIPTPFKAVEVWDAHKKLGQATALAAIERAIKLADKYGTGTIAVDNAFHYLWGGGYVLEAAKRGYIAYTCCTAALTEVVPLGGKYPTLGTNPHSWGLPTADALGYPLVIDWATSVVAMGRVQQLAREGGTLPPNAAVDADGNPTTDPAKAVSLLPFGAHKGYGLSLVNELYAAFIGGSLPTLRCRAPVENEKQTPAFYFQVIHPESLASGKFAFGRTQEENVKAVLADIFGHGNEGCTLPGQIEARAASRSRENGGLLFSEAEVSALNEIAREAGRRAWKLEDLRIAK
ncbi:MAG: Ldh family oxidoreductase [Puniceicoccales bacterium]|jgi:L-2-hydroxycarboxylate dehydrogenase (NAD+)|nr:Ldh family oxidoreductase [Puniceicoccales bacterium]